MWTAAILLFLTTPQEPGRYTLDRTGTIEEAVQDLRAASGATFTIDPKIGKKIYRVRTAGTGFFESVDAICRGHGGARYFDAPAGPDEGTLRLRPEPWIEYPSSYTPDFKVIVSEVAGFTARLPEADQQWSRVYLVLFGPPWLRIRKESGTKAKWTIDEARDADGKDLLPPRGQPEMNHRVDLVWHPRYYEGNVISQALPLRPYDLDLGLRILRGTVQLTMADSIDVKLPLVAGTTVETSAGTLTVDAVKEHEQTAQGSTWRVGLTLKPASGAADLRKVLENRFRCEGPQGGEKWFELDLPDKGASFEAVIRRTPQLPASIRLAVREGERKLQVPFSFQDVRFKKN